MNKTVEQKVLFPFVRIISVVFIILSICGLAFAFVSWNNVEPESKVSYKAVKEAMSLEKPATGQAADNTADIPANVQKYMGNSNAKILDGWLKPLKPAQKKDFLLNMSEVVSVAEKNNDNVVDAINAYKTLKLDKLASGEMGKVADKMKPLAYGMAIMSTLLLIIMFSLVLIMLSIERNTRREIDPMQVPSTSSIESPTKM